jgi:hypothetical protein
MVGILINLNRNLSKQYEINKFDYQILSALYIHKVLLLMGLKLKDLDPWCMDLGFYITLKSPDGLVY